MKAFAIPLLLSIEYGVFILGKHLFLPWHLFVPPIDCFCSHAAVLLEGHADGVYDSVDEPKSLPLPGFLRR